MRNFAVWELQKEVELPKILFKTATLYSSIFERALWDADMNHR